MHKLTRLFAALSLTSAFFVSSVGNAAEEANMSRIAGVESSSGFRATTCSLRKNLRHSTCWRNGHRVRCCTRWICR